MTVDLHYRWGHWVLPVFSALGLLAQYRWVSCGRGTRLCSDSSGGGDHDVDVVCCGWCLEGDVRSVERSVVVDYLVVVGYYVEDLLFEWCVSRCVGDNVGEFVPDGVVSLVPVWAKLALQCVIKMTVVNVAAS